MYTYVLYKMQHIGLLFSSHYVQIKCFHILLQAQVSFQPWDVENYVKLNISCKTRLYNGFIRKVGEQMDFCSCELK